MVTWGSRAGAGVREVLRVEIGLEWEEKMRMMTNSVNYLVEKFRRSRLEEVPNTLTYCLNNAIVLNWTT